MHHFVLLFLFLAILGRSASLADVTTNGAAEKVVSSQKHVKTEVELVSTFIRASYHCVSCVPNSCKKWHSCYWANRKYLTGCPVKNTWWATSGSFCAGKQWCRCDRRGSAWYCKSCMRSWCRMSSTCYLANRWKNIDPCPRKGYWSESTDKCSDDFHCSCRKFR